MALALCSAFMLVLCATLAPCVSAGDRDCQSYRDGSNMYHFSEKCYIGFCCGTCTSRYCCQDTVYRISEDEQELCDNIGFLSHSPVPMIIGIVGFIVCFLIFICCCVCPCCCLYKMCRKPRPVVATTTHTTVVTTTPQQYPQQPTAAPVPPQFYQGVQYPAYQSLPVQPGYGASPMPTSTYPGQSFMPGPPTYQEATSSGYPPQPMPYSQAAYAPGQPAYPLQPPSAPQPNAPAPQMDFSAQPAYNPDFVAPPHK